VDYWCGLDLGSHVDYSAVSVLARSLAINPDTRHPVRDSRGRALYEWRLRGLYRFPHRTPYPEVAAKTARIASLPQLRPRPRVVVDSTGVGVACVEQVRTAMRPFPEIEVWGVSITSGEGWRVSGLHSLNCSKIQLVGSFREALEGNRFKVCLRGDGEPARGADVLRRELSAFKVKASKTSNNESFGADSGDHDDVVLSCSLPVWCGSLPFMTMRERSTRPDDPGYRPREMDALQAEEEMILADEQEAIDREEGKITARMIEAAKVDPWKAFSWRKTC
jgi:hypothetical protein